MQLNFRRKFFNVGTQFVRMVRDLKNARVRAVLSNESERISVPSRKLGYFIDATRLFIINSHLFQSVAVNKNHRLGHGDC